jgi:hypothetical protein
MADVTDVIPVAMPIIQKVAAVYLKHTSPWFIGLIIHGSAVKGGFIPGCSDIDFQLFLDDTAFTWCGELALEVGFSIQRDLAKIDPAPFGYIQCHARKVEQSDNIIGPISGAYRVIAGTLPVAEATTEQLRESARQELAGLNAPTFVISELLGHGGERLAHNLRLLCTKVWPVLYQVLTLQQEDAIGIWNLRKEQAVDRLPQKTALRETIQRFYRAVQAYYSAEESLEEAFLVIESGAAFLGAAKPWWGAVNNRA